MKTFNSIVLAKTISRSNDVIRADFDFSEKSNDPKYLTEMYKKGYTDLHIVADQSKTLLPSEHGCEDVEEMFEHLLGCY